MFRLALVPYSFQWVSAGQPPTCQTLGGSPGVSPGAANHGAHQVAARLGKMANYSHLTRYEVEGNVFGLVWNAAAYEMVPSSELRLTPAYRRTREYHRQNATADACTLEASELGYGYHSMLQWVAVVLVTAQISLDSSASEHAAFVIAQISLDDDSMRVVARNTFVTARISYDVAVAPTSLDGVPHELPTLLSFSFSFIVDCKEVITLARSTEHLSEILSRRIPLPSPNEESRRNA